MDTEAVGCTQKLRMGATSVAFLEQGSGVPVLLLHSSMSSAAQWRALSERLSPRFRVIAPDLHGYGETATWRGDGPFSLEHEARIAYALLARCGEPAHVVGHSYGGAVALHIARELARERGDLVRSLTVIEPVAFHLLRDGDAADAARLAGLERMSAPTLVLRGERSPAPARRICEHLARVLPEARLETIAGAGHMCPLTHGDEVNALIAGHLESQPGNHITTSREAGFHQPRRTPWTQQL